MVRDKRIVLVTGANKGIGFEIARQLARKGFHVFLGARDEKAGRAAAEKLRNEGEITLIKIDIASPESIVRAAEEFSRQSDRLDTLINNAGILLDEDKDILKISAETFGKTLRTNALGPLLVSQAFVPLLKKSRVPRVLLHNWPRPCRVSPLIRFVPAGSGPTWAAPMPLAPSKKARVALSGWQPMLLKQKPANSGETGRSFLGDEKIAR